MSRPLGVPPLLVALLVGVTAGLVFAPVTLGHGGAGEPELQVEPGSISAGQTVELAGSGLEPDDERVIVLVGGDLTVSFGTVTTDADGMFAIELVIPGHLPSGAYELQAIGDETLTVPLAVTGAADGDQATTRPEEAVVPRDRSPIELGLIGAVAAAALVAGVILVLIAERAVGGRRGREKSVPETPKG